MTVNSRAPLTISYIVYTCFVSGYITHDDVVCAFTIRDIEFVTYRLQTLRSSLIKILFFICVCFFFKTSDFGEGIEFNIQSIKYT